MIHRAMTSTPEMPLRAARPRLGEALALVGDEKSASGPTQALIERAVARGLMRESQVESVAFASLEDCDRCEGSGRAGYNYGLCTSCGGCGIEFGSRHIPVDLATFIALCAAPSEVAAAEQAAIELYVRYVGARPRFVRWFGTATEHGWRLATSYRVPAWPRSSNDPPYRQWSALSTNFSAVLVALERGVALPDVPHVDILASICRSGFWIVSIEGGMVLFVPTDGLR